MLGSNLSARQMVEVCGSYRSGTAPSLVESHTLARNALNPGGMGAGPHSDGQHSFFTSTQLAIAQMKALSSLAIAITTTFLGFPLPASRRYRSHKRT